MIIFILFNNILYFKSQEVQIILNFLIKFDIVVVDLIVLAANQILVVLQIVNNAASKDNYSSSISSSSVSVISSASITAISIVTVSTSFISGCSPQSLWSMINQYQLFMLFPMIGVYIPEEVIHFLRGVSFWLFNFSFISLSKLGIYEKFVSFFDWKSNSSYLSSIGFDSVWMIINHLMLVAILFSFIIFSFSYTYFVFTYFVQSI